jgi:hypothetical protein
MLLKLLFLQLTNNEGIYILIVFEIYHDTVHEVGNLVDCGFAEIDRFDPSSSLRRYFYGVMRCVLRPS